MAEETAQADAPESGTATPPRARRRQGVRLTAAERAAAQDKFLAIFAATANVAASCLQAEIDRATVYKWQEHDAPFSVRYHQAELDAQDVVRAAIQRRGVEGWEEVVVSHGKVVYFKGKPLTIRKYSDACLLALAKARVPEYRDKVDVTLQGGVTHDHRIIESDPEAADLARALIRRVSARSAE
jgi:hypothetical protein